MKRFVFYCFFLMSLTLLYFFWWNGGSAFLCGCRGFCYFWEGWTSAFYLLVARGSAIWGVVGGLLFCSRGFAFLRWGWRRILSFFVWWDILLFVTRRFCFFCDEGLLFCTSEDFSFFFLFGGGDFCFLFGSRVFCFSFFFYLMAVLLFLEGGRDLLFVIISGLILLDKLRF